MGVSFFVQPILKQQFCPQKSQPLLLAKGGLISESFSLWLKSPKKSAHEHYPPKGQIKPKAVCFLGESIAHHSAFSFI